MTQVDTGLLSDKDFHALVKTDLPQVLLKLGYKEKDLKGKEVVLVANTKDTFYIAMPENYDDIKLEYINAAGVAPGTAACLSTLGSVLCFPATASTISTGASFGSVGCAIIDE